MNDRSSNDSRRIFEFGHFRLLATERMLFNGEKHVHLPPKVFDTLCCLVSNAGRIVSKQRLLDEVWNGSFVEENNLAQCISSLRKVLGESVETKFIETVPKFGYRFVAPLLPGDSRNTVEVVDTSAARVYFSELGQDTVTPRLPAVKSALRWPQTETRYVQNDEVNIAYQVIGDGPVDIVFVMGWVSHLEYFWKHHTFASFLEKLASFSRLILFDKRGTGLSDRVPIAQLPTLEQRMEDLHVVMDAVGSKNAVLFGVSEGGPMCALFAATYPERTKALVMFGTYAKRIRDEDYPWAPSFDERQAFFELMKREWGKPVGIKERAPSLANDPEFRSWWAEYLRMGASPGAAVALTEMNAEIDVRNVLPLVHVPTLVIHRSDDRCLKIEEGRYVASLIPGCRFNALPGSDHLPFVGDQDAVISAIEQFVEQNAAESDREHVLATVMSIKLGNHGELRSKDDLADQFRESFIRNLSLFRGREITCVEGECLAAFDGPARAIRCALSITKAARNSGLSVRAALHTGECEFRADQYSGFAVDLARKIAEETETGMVLVSRTVKDLVAGSGLEFTEYGVKCYDGMEGEWLLFSVM